MTLRQRLLEMRSQGFCTAEVWVQLVDELDHIKQELADLKSASAQLTAGKQLQEINLALASEQKLKADSCTHVATSIELGRLIQSKDVMIADLEQRLQGIKEQFDYQRALLHQIQDILNGHRGPGASCVLFSEIPLVLQSMLTNRKHINLSPDDIQRIKNAAKALLNGGFNFNTLFATSPEKVARILNAVVAHASPLAKKD